MAEEEPPADPITRLPRRMIGLALQDEDEQHPRTNDLEEETGWTDGWDDRPIPQRLSMLILSMGRFPSEPSAPRSLFTEILRTMDQMHTMHEQLSHELNSTNEELGREIRELRLEVESLRNHQHTGHHERWYVIAKGRWKPRTQEFVSLITT